MPINTPINQSVTLQVEHKVPQLRHHAALHMKHRCSRVAKYEALEGGLVYTGWNMTCSPRANRLYTARERAAGRQQGRGKVARLARIQKSKNSGSWCAKAFYCTKYKYLVKNGGTSGKFWKGYFEKPGPQKTWLRNSLTRDEFSSAIVSTAEGKRTERFSENSSRNRDSLKSEVRLPRD